MPIFLGLNFAPNQTVAADPGGRLRDQWTRAGDRSPDALRWLYEFDASVVEPVPA